MAMQAGTGLSRIILLLGAGYTGTILLKNGKLSDVLGELQVLNLVKGMARSGKVDGDADHSDAIASQCLSFSDLMYVTKRNMANAVSNLTKHLEHVSEALAATKRHLTQRIENLDGKLDDQVEISKLIRSEVNDVRGDLSQIGFDLDELQRMVSGLDGRLFSLEGKQELTNAGVMYLCSIANGRKAKMPDMLRVAASSIGFFSFFA